MKRTGEKNATLIVAIAWMFMVSCAAMVRSSIKEDDKQIPVGFGKEDVTILAVQQNERYNKWLEKRFPENYFGKFVIISAADLSSTKYKDTKKYRYIFKEAEVERRDLSNMKNFQTDTYVSYSLTDRSTGTVYKTKNVYGAPTALMRDYLMVLEKVRQKNSGGGN